MAVECSILVEILKNVHLGTYIKAVMSRSGGWGGVEWGDVPAWWPDLPLAGYESSLFSELSSSVKSK